MKSRHAKVSVALGIGLFIVTVGGGSAHGDDPTPAQNKHHVHVKGTVRDLTGAPMAGVRVQITGAVHMALVNQYAPACRQSTYNGGFATTRADGAYDLKVYLPGTAACGDQINAIAIDKTKIKLEKYGFTFQPASP